MSATLSSDAKMSPAEMNRYLATLMAKRGGGGGGDDDDDDGMPGLEVRFFLPNGGNKRTPVPPPRAGR